MVWFGIPGTSWGVDVDLPDPKAYAEEIIGKANRMLEDLKTRVFSVFTDIASRVGSGLHGIITSVPSKVFETITTMIRVFWNKLRGVE